MDENYLQKESYQHNFMNPEDEGVSLESPISADIPQAALSPIERVLAKVPEIAFLILAASLPLITITGLYDIGEFPKILLIAASACLLISMLGIRLMNMSVLQVKIPILALPLGGVLLSAILIASQSVYTPSSIFGHAESRASALVSVAAFIFLLTVLAGSRAQLRERTLLVFRISLLVGLVWTIFQSLGLEILAPVLGNLGSGFSPLGSLNSAGLVACVLLVFSYDLTNRAISRFQQGLTIVSFIAAVLVLFIINWWPLWLVGSIAFIANFIFRWKMGSAQRVHGLSSAIFAGAAIIALFTTFGSGLRANLPLQVSPSFQSGIAIAKLAISERALGFGQENFLYAFDLYRPLSVASTIFHTARFSESTSQSLTNSVEGGVLSFISTLVLMLLTLRQIAVRFKSGAVDDRWVQKSVALIVLFIGFFLFSLNAVHVFCGVILLADLLATSPIWKSWTFSLSDNNRSFLGSLTGIILCIFGFFGLYYGVEVARANYYLAQAASSSGNLGNAIEKIVASINLYPYDDRAYRGLAEALLVRVADDLRAGPQKDEKQADYVQRIQAQINTLTQVGSRLTELNPSDFQNWFQRAYIYQNLAAVVPGADQLALSMYEEALTRNPRYPLAYYRIGNTFLEAAEANLRLLSSGKSKIPKKQLEDAIAKQYAAAEQSYVKAIELYPNYGDALYNLAALYEREGKLRQSIVNLEKAVRTSSDNPSLVFQLGLLYYRNNQKDAALNSWTRAVEISPSFSNARWYLSLILEERGRIDEALDQVREIEKYNKDNDLVKKRISDLSQGKRLIPPAKVLDQKPL